VVNELAMVIITIEVNEMKYALIGDLHSSIKDTKAVLKQIEACNLQSNIIGIGDLYECMIGKKKLQTLTTKLPLTEAAIVKPKFENLLTFPSVIGNQEERIALVTGETRFLKFPEKIMIEHATVMHGHQFDYTESFELIPPSFDTPLLFFGHSHYSALYVDNVRHQIIMDVPYQLSDGKQYIINVGSVIDKREWCIYDSEQMTVTFKKAD
jgi:predicted phosphodiesterase